MKYVAFLRGINVGGNRKVEMLKLKRCFEKIGYKNVSTYINTGNVIFESNKKSTKTLASEIEKALKKTFGFPIPTVVRDEKNIQKVAKAIPAKWENNKDQKTDVLFLWEKFDKKATIQLIKTTPKVDTLKYIDGSIIWNVDRAKYNKSGMNDFIGTDVYKHMTARNVNTVRKLATLVKER